MGRSGDVDAMLTFLAISLMCDEGLALGLPAYFCTLYDGAKSLTPHCTPVDDSRHCTVQCAIWSLKGYHWQENYRVEGAVP